jgi:hypothetical protein
MSETPSNTESLMTLIEGIDKEIIMLPEFQRDFTWELEQTFDLFDSLVRGIFIGTVIYGKPSFEMTLRLMDNRPRKGKGSREKLKTKSYSDDEMKQLANTKGLRIVLDGQQRCTSIYRALKGIDTVYFYAKENISVEDVKSSLLENLLDGFQGTDSDERVTVRLNDAYELAKDSLDDDELNFKFANMKLGKRLTETSTKEERDKKMKIYRAVARKLSDLLKKDKLVTYYLLDMDVEKFCMFFERSNSRGIQLNFTDILAAKLYSNFNLRKKIEEFEEQYPQLELNRELIVRGIAILSDKFSKIEKQEILKKLDATHFNQYWNEVCKLYVEAIKYLESQRLVVSLKWIPYESILLPLMTFLREVKGVSNITESQRQFLFWWYWASVFSARYSQSSNETIAVDANALRDVARGKKLPATYFARFNMVIDKPEDLFSYTKSASSIYRGFLNVLHFSSVNGLKDWNSSQSIPKDKLEDHHIFPKAYIDSGRNFDVVTHEAGMLSESVVNRTLVPKLTNIKIGKKSPYMYLNELLDKNSNLEASLESHLVPLGLLRHEASSEQLSEFLSERANKAFDLIKKQATEPLDTIRREFGQASNS